MNFDQQKKYIQNNKKIEMARFNKVSDITQMIDFLNKEVEDKSEKRADDEIHSISQFLAKLQTSKSIRMGK